MPAKHQPELASKKAWTVKASGESAERKAAGAARNRGNVMSVHAALTSGRFKVYSTPTKPRLFTTEQIAEAIAKLDSARRRR